MVEPNRADLIAELRRAERALRDAGSRWRDVPGVARLPLLDAAHRAERLLGRFERRARVMQGRQSRYR